MFRSPNVYEEYLNVLYNYLRPGATGALKGNIEKIISVLEDLRGYKFNISPWKFYYDLFMSDDPELESFKTELIKEYQKRTGKAIPASKLTLAREIWKMIVAEELTNKEFFLYSPTDDPIPDETDECRYRE
ncbi:hypothetical protein TVAG_213490 [Trichomonas vaginalis G3]|uniref:Uncharacterized protein n=1 Tax=Trichomonas vaginalis (strain ATCC PRA-98 / G3) TaxID=412133 RepID=A2EYT1_TRIV3|nr:hypothetical protein TVAGG3_0254250 [Trichomonas vaginalis G3]EAY02150.1 hypothetical protein TVAG_213490 [Trichomonas vaginalis G3]KAI5554247.1 hypothetical protein TVAGG3_0254250 [Trichomonas vaginalis G3]|eukprot:XP_001314524.1 hypothetical protein [Trichomonas vaginalis G3]